MSPLDLTVILNAMARYNVKISPEFVQLVSIVLDPAQNGIQRVKMLKDIEVNRLLQALLFYATPSNINQPEKQTQCIPTPVLNSFIKELLDRFKESAIELNKNATEIPVTTQRVEQQSQTRCLQSLFSRLSQLRIKVDLTIYNEARSFLLYLEKTSCVEPGQVVKQTKSN